MRKNQQIDQRLDLLVATVEQARALVHRGESEAAIALLSVDLVDQSKHAQQMLAGRSSRMRLALALGISPQGVSKRYPGAFSH